jgi:hypothetical protein
MRCGSPPAAPLIGGSVWRTGGPSWRLKGAMAPPTQLKFTQYYLVFISFDHVKYKIFQISPLNFYVMTFGPSYNDGQGPPLLIELTMVRSITQRKEKRTQQNFQKISQIKEWDTYMLRKNLSVFSSSFHSINGWTCGHGT